MKILNVIAMIFTVVGFAAWLFIFMFFDSFEQMGF